MLNKDYILEKIKEYCILDENLTEQTFFEMVVEPLQNANCFSSWTWDSGVTKGVLIFDELDYVIKIPLYCEYVEPCYGYDEENDESYVIEEGGPSGWCFGGVQVEGYIHDNNWDYCETESYRYLEAEKNAVSEYFAKTWFIGSVHSWPVYAQTRANMYCSSDSRTARSKKTYSQKEKDTVKHIKKSTGFYVADEWMIDFINYWGEESLANLIKFCDAQYIGDLHYGNIGYICGAPCLVDYSSFEC